MDSRRPLSDRLRDGPHPSQADGSGIVTSRATSRVASQACDSRTSAKFHLAHRIGIDVHDGRCSKK